MFFIVIWWQYGTIVIVWLLFYSPRPFNRVFKRQNLTMGSQAIHLFVFQQVYIFCIGLIAFILRFHLNLPLLKPLSLLYFTLLTANIDPGTREMFFYGSIGPPTDNARGEKKKKLKR